jgi:hypothetical protein
MANSKLAIGLEKLVNNSANLLGRMQVGVNKVLWGNSNTQPVQSVKYDTVSGSLSYTVNTPTAPLQPKGNLVDSGLFNALNALNQVDLCNVITYVTDNINIKKKKRPDKPWNAPQISLYTLQDQAALVTTYIDKYTAYPNVFIGSYVGLGSNAQLPQQAFSQSNAPVQGGKDVQKYNLYFLMKTIKETFSFNTPGTGSLFTSGDKTLLTTVPGLGSNLNIVDDFIGIVNKYNDYRQIPNSDLQNLQNKVTTLRSVCVTIQNLDFRSSLALAGNFLNIDIRSQIQQLSKFVDPTKIIPTLKQINSATRTFIRIARQVQGILNLGQFIIKLGLLFYKVFRFVIAFFTSLPLPSLYTTVGIQQRLRDAKDVAKNESDGIMRVLKAVNALLAITVTFIRYLLANTNELLSKLETLQLTLDACEAVKDSDVVRELKETTLALKALEEDLVAYITKYDSKIDPNTALFGVYQIRTVEEEVTDPTLNYKRRRGIALDQNGKLVASSDLTFATNPEVIIGEVKQKLVSLKLVQPSLGNLDATNLAIISNSLDYLDNNDVIQDDLNISEISTTIQESLGENQGLGLNNFINNLSGGRKLRQRVTTALSAASLNLRNQVAKEKANAASSLQTK